ncbi:protein translocase subunit SecD [Mangrovicoccus algicola]|uniref:Protein translocase subunit SecD n=1 Tax=Mangrovicoccus algicola TaxID=2771008 RepID=A0A8J6Z619_9RHOB|nr:protein translocase subunit SecD [Mangrovicoccus algicola]MBE3637040.1 protein translocase subunit SecD [Mangrovicoccus algicola]
MLDVPVWKRVLVTGLCVAGLLFAAPNLFYSRVESHNDALQAVERTGTTTPELQAAADGWPSFLPSGLVNLGLDLRGGAHLLAEVHTQDVYADRMDNLWPEIRDALRAERGTIGTIRRQDSAPDELRIRVGNPDNIQAAVRAVADLSSPIVSLTGVGARDFEASAEGAEVVVRLSEAERAATDDRTMRQSLEIIRRRVDEAGTREPTIQRQGEDRILIQVPGIGSAQELKNLIGTTARLTFNEVAGRTASENQPVDPGQELVPAMNEPGTFYAIETTAVVSGEDLTDAQPSFDQNGRPAVSFRFNPGGARRFGDFTAGHIGEPFAIVLDGEVVSAPVIQSHIAGGSGIITGNFDVEESTQLAVLLRAGALPAEMTFLEERTIGPELGADSIRAGALACAVAFVAVLIFMFAAYGLFGLFANIALIINIGLIFGALSLIGATLTLPGIAGIVLTIGMAVDANVLIFERIKEELKTARGPARAIELGYEKAFSAIADANITTLITAGILYFMGSGPVKGFAITLGIGIITSVFAAIYVTRLIVVAWFSRARPKTLEV